MLILLIMNCFEIPALADIRCCETPCVYHDFAIGVNIERDFGLEFPQPNGDLAKLSEFFAINVNKLGIQENYRTWDQSLISSPKQQIK